MKTYLVGGAVRDILLGQAPVELDYAVDGDDAAFLATHPDAARVGKSVQVCLWHRSVVGACLRIWPPVT